MAHGQQRRARLFLVSVGDACQRKRREAVRVWVGIFLDRGNIRAIPGDPRLRFRDLFRKALADGVLQRVFLRKMVGFQQLQLDTSMSRSIFSLIMGLPLASALISA